MQHAAGRRLLLARNAATGSAPITWLSLVRRSHGVGADPGDERFPNPDSMGHGATLREATARCRARVLVSHQLGSLGLEHKLRRDR